MSVRVAINGFGRIGRLFFRLAHSRPELKFVAINDLGEVDNLAYLLKYDTVYRQFPAEIRGITKVDRGQTRNYLLVDGAEILFLQEKDPTSLPWKELDVDVAVESTGAFESFEKAAAHLRAGAKRVVLTAPAKDEDGPQGKTVLMGVNEHEMDVCPITSNGSCTTNAAHPVVQILHETLGVGKAFLTTTHGYTATQSLVDGSAKGKDWRRGRAAAQNIVPSSTGAAISVTRAVKDLAGKFDGVALRVPIVSGSAAQIAAVVGRRTSVEEVNEIFRKAVEDPRWKNIVKVTDEQIVSADIVGEPYGAIVDLTFTRVIDGDLVAVLSWYDNEMGYCQTLVEHVLRAAKALGK
jgi:glyceraldehyde 3-phosphate dehydrogenase